MNGTLLCFPVPVRSSKKRFQNEYFSFRNNIIAKIINFVLVKYENSTSKEISERYLVKNKFIGANLLSCSILVYSTTPCVSFAFSIVRDSSSRTAGFGMTLSFWVKGWEEVAIRDKFLIITQFQIRIAASSLYPHKNEMSFRKNPPQTNLRP
jgi:hypothetical protein